MQREARGKCNPYRRRAALSKRGNGGGLCNPQSPDGNCQKAFVGCSGIDAVMGMTTENANEVTINQLMVRNVAKDAYILADHTKLGQISSFISCPIEEIHYLITDELAPAEAVEELRAKGVRVHQVKKADFPNEGLINQTEKKGK